MPLRGIFMRSKSLDRDTPRIALVDDDAAVRNSLARLLTLAGFVVAAFDSAENFLKARANEPCACLVVDLTMPGMSGTDLKGVLAESEPDLPVILISGSPEAHVQQVAKEWGFAACLTKPLSGDDLISAIRQALHTAKSGRKK
jgi:FixJ family two-component response regulator